MSRHYLKHICGYSTAHHDISIYNIYVYTYEFAIRMLKNQSIYNQENLFN